MRPFQSIAGLITLAVQFVPVAADARVTKVVELFQSRRCPACPGAQANLDALARQSDLLALSYPVALLADPDDTAARPEFLARQQAYVDSMGEAGVYTPQMVLNGRHSFPGSEAATVSVTLARATPIESRPVLQEVGDRLDVQGARTLRLHRLWVVSYRPEGPGPHHAQRRAAPEALARSIVIDIRALGTWSGRPSRFRLPTPIPGTRRAVLLQEDGAGPILAALELSR